MKKFLFILFVVCFQLTIVYSQYDTIDVDGVKRTYKLAVPDLYTGSDSVPMVIGLHYLGSNGSQFESSTDFSVLGARENFISVYPNGLNGAWNGGGCCNPAVEDNVDDVGFISTLIDTLIQKYNIDTNRIYVAGFSNGSIMAYRLANEISGKIAAVGCVSGQSFQDVISPSAKVPIIHFHALDDNSVNFDGGTIDEYDYKPVLEVIDTWKDFNECTEDSIIIRDEDGIKGYLWTSDGDSSNIILYTSNTGGHSWIMNKRLGITNLMWEFFNTGNTTVPVSYDSIDHDGLYRSFKTHLPNQYYTEVSDTVTYPIILAFHGWDQDADIMETNTGMSDKADKEGFIVSYLNYVGPPPDTSWNYFMFENKPDDIGFTERVLDTLISQYPVDTSKVYVIGFSDGCGMADRLPFALPGRIKGAGTVSGMIAFDDSVETHKVPLIHVNYNHDAAYTNVQERIPYWVELNGCNTEADTTVNAQDVIGRRWENPDGINHVVVISAPGSSHAWVNTDDVKATDLIWEFFETGNAIPDVDTLQVSISDKKGENKLYIYPNPADDVVNIVSGGNLTGTVTVELLDVNGRIVYQETYTGKESMEIKLPANIVKGLYFVKLTDENKMYSGKLLIR